MRSAALARAVVVGAGVYAAAACLAVLAGMTLAGASAEVAGGGCGGDGGPGGGAQQVAGTPLGSEQMDNARTITTTALQRRLPKRAAVVATAAALVESGLRNLDYGDRDSLGILQQRPSQGWGGPAQIRNPAYAANTFYDHLLAIPGWPSMPAGQAAQAVQRSAYPDRYAAQVGPARALVAKFWVGPDNPAPPTNRRAASAAAVAARTGCPDQGGANTPLDRRTLPPGFTLPTDPRQRAAVRYALAQLGKPYVWGAKGPQAFDCSGLTQAAWAAAGVSLSAGTTNQVHDGTPVPGIAAAQPGDLLFIPGSLGTTSTPRHVGIYAGHGVLVNAYDQNTGVVLESLHAWSEDVVAIRRPAGAASDPGGGV